MIFPGTISLAGDEEVRQSSNRLVAQAHLRWGRYFVVDTLIRRTPDGG